MAGEFCVNGILNELIFKSFLSRKHIRFPTEATITAYYKELNYGAFFQQQMRESLYFQQVQQHRDLNINTTVQLMLREIRGYMPFSWRVAVTQARCVGLGGQVITEPIKERIAASWVARQDWVHRNRNVLVDFRSSVLGEDRNDFIHSDLEDEEGMGELVDGVEEEEDSEDDFL